MTYDTAYLRTVLIGSLALFSSACSDDGDEEALAPDGGDDAAPSADAAAEDDCEVVVADADCDTSLRPFVFIHGTFGSATEISNVAHLFGSNGYCQDRFVAVEYNSLGGSPIEQLADLVDQVRADTGFDQVELAGHSQGTRHACTYLDDPANRDKVAHYINISGGCDGRGVPTLSLSSQKDGVGGLPPGPIHPSGPDVTQVTLEQEDHVALAGSKQSFLAIYEYLYEKEPEYTTIQCGQNPIVLDGKVVTFGDNEPRANATIDFFRIAALADTPWERGEPAETVTADAAGHFRVELERNELYEVRLIDTDGTLLGYGYPGPFVRSNYISRFLTESLNSLVAAESTDRVVRSSNHAAFVARYVAGALRKDWNNSLKIDGEEVLSDENAGAYEADKSSVVGFFMYDANENGESDLGAVFGPSSFLVGTDVFMDASTPRWMDVEWTNEEGRSIMMKIPNWPSDETLASINLPYP